MLAPAQGYFQFKMQANDLKPQFETAVESFLKVSGLIEQRIKVLEEKERRWLELETKLKENAVTAKSKIILDVGGKKFATSKSTLLSHTDSYFYGLLSSGHWQPDEDGSYFIDRNPKYFSVILDYMRGGKINLKSWNKGDVKRLQEDLDYYQIQVPGLENQKQLDITFANNMKQAIITRSYVINKGTLLERGKFRWQVRIDKVASSTDVGVVSPQHISHFNRQTKTAWGLREDGSVPYQAQKAVEFKDGNVIGFILDLDARTLQIAVNNRHCYTHIDVVSPVQVAFCGNVSASATIL